MALATKSTIHSGFKARIERHSDESAANTALTVTVPTGRLRRLLLVTIKYSGAASVTVTVTLNSGAGSTYDVLLASTALSAETDFTFTPDEETLLSDDDAIDVLAPAVVGVTSAITVVTRVL